MIIFDITGSAERKMSETHRINSLKRTLSDDRILHYSRMEHRRRDGPQTEKIRGRHLDFPHQLDKHPNGQGRFRRRCREIRPVASEQEFGDRRRRGASSGIEEDWKRRSFPACFA